MYFYQNKSSGFHCDPLGRQGDPKVQLLQDHPTLDDYPNVLLWEQIVWTSGT